MKKIATWVTRYLGDLGPTILALLLVALIDIVWCFFGKWTVKLGPMPKFILFCSLPLACLMLVPRYRNDPRIGHTLGGLLVFVLSICINGVFSYLMVSTNASLVDVELAAMDKALGFDWQAASLTINNAPDIRLPFALCYASGLFQILFIIVFLGLTGRTRQLDEFLFLIVVGALLTVTIAAVFPAVGPWYDLQGATPFDASVLSDFAPLRDGSLRAIELGKTQGLVSMPSFHTMLALFLAYSMRGTGLLFPISIALNSLMIVATPTMGGHYLVDVIAGTLCAGALIAGYRHHASVSVMTALSAT